MGFPGKGNCEEYVDVMSYLGNWNQVQQQRQCVKFTVKCLKCLTNGPLLKSRTLGRLDRSGAIAGGC